MIERERVFPAVGGAPVDGVPLSLWRHFYPIPVTSDPTAIDAAAAALAGG